MYTRYKFIIQLAVLMKIKAANFLLGMSNNYAQLYAHVGKRMECVVYDN